jgi:hypothetical protein
VLWTPGSGVECGVLEPASPGFGKRHVDAQAACEPGGGGCGGVPVHPPRLHTHRTSPAQALLTILETCCNVGPALALPPSCVWCPVCTSGSLRDERGLVTAVQRSRVSGGFRKGLTGGGL